ncbi:MAG: hypothetical protein KBT20_08725 [Bacteroidales bacterium]|nr:hypothetical protein [Candidatus Liminaster caballi]
MIRKIFLTLICALTLTCAWAQDSAPATYFLPADGVYLVGLPADLSPVVSEPTMVTQAYQAKFQTVNAELAAIRVNEKGMNISQLLNADGTLLDMSQFLGIGEVSGLIVRTIDGQSYQLGDLAPQRTWQSTRILSACGVWNGHKTLPLAVYDQWDCPVTFDRDPMLGAGRHDALTVNFGNPHEGLVIKAVTFPLVVADGCNMQGTLKVGLTMWDEQHTKVTDQMECDVELSSLECVSTGNGCKVYAVRAFDYVFGTVTSSPFEVTVSGFSQAGIDAWLPRAIDTHGLYPTHTSYGDVRVPESDACIALDAYFNYLGTWGWWDGKSERGEVVSNGDLVQVYYEQDDPNWPGDYFMGEASFPVECTFGMGDITVDEKPDWISEIMLDDSQWAEYGAVQLSMYADPLPSDMTGRNGKVVFITKDRASRYTIYIRQGTAWFDFDEPLPDIPILSITTQSGVSLPDAHIEVESEEIVSHIYVQYDDELQSSVKASGYGDFVTITNITKNRQLTLNTYSCGLKTDATGRKTIIDIFLSSDSYIKGDSKKGEYVVSILPGLAHNSAGALTAGTTFSFTYGVEPSGIESVGESNESSPNEYIYNIYGIRTASPKGMVIIDGHKVMLK